MTSLNNLLKFTSFTHKFQQVKRIIFVTGEDRLENDSEHSFQLALLGWYIISSSKLDLNIDLVIKYSLVHDLVETYAGDTYFHTTDRKERDSKVDREAEAAKRIQEEFPDFDDLHTLIQDYESKSNPEAKFVYALDKLIPVLNIYLDNGRSWHEHKVTLKMARTKDEKIAVSPEVTKLWKELVKLLEKDEDTLFPDI